MIQMAQAESVTARPPEERKPCPYEPRQDEIYRKSFLLNIAGIVSDSDYSRKKWESGKKHGPDSSKEKSSLL
jgi:hypothetical protein